MDVTIEQIPVLLAIFAAGIAGGAVNAIAGGGTNITFPMLLWIGIPPVAANVTSAVSLWPGGISGAWGFRERLGEVKREWHWLLVPSVIGGAGGAWLLVNTPQAIFRSIVPWLILVSSVLIAAQPRMKRLLRLPVDGSRRTFATAIAAQFLIASYGGYFGSGLGLMMLVTLGLSGIHQIHHANALKNMLGVAIKGVAVAYFIVAGSVVWMAVIFMGIGAVLGGYAGARLAQRIPEKPMRWTIAAFGIIVALLMLIR